MDDAPAAAGPSLRQRLRGLLLLLPYSISATAVLGGAVVVWNCAAMASVGSDIPWRWALGVIAANLAFLAVLGRSAGKAELRASALVAPAVIVMATLVPAVTLPWVTLQATDLSSANIDDYLDDQAFAVVFFTADWCTPCKRLAPVLGQVARDLDIAVARLDTETSPAVARRFEVEAIPVVLVVSGATEMGRLVGWRSRSQLRSELRSLRSRAPTRDPG